MAKDKEEELNRRIEEIERAIDKARGEALTEEQEREEIRKEEKEVGKEEGRRIVRTEVKEVEYILRKIEDEREKERKNEEYRKQQEKLKEKPNYGIRWIGEIPEEKKERIDWIKNKSAEMYKNYNIQRLIKWLDRLVELKEISEIDKNEILYQITGGRVGSDWIEQLGIKKPPFEKRVEIPRGPIEVVGTPIGFENLEEKIRQRLESGEGKESTLLDALNLLNTAKEYYRIGDEKSSIEYFREAKNLFNESIKEQKERDKVIEKGYKKSMPFWQRGLTRYKAKKLGVDVKHTGKETGGWLLRRGPEEFKIPRAIAYGKRELDRRARGINKEALIKPGRERIKKEKENLKIDEYKKTFDEKNRKIAPKETEKNKIEAKIEELYKELEGIKSWDPISKSAESERIGKLLRKHENELSNLNRELISLRQEAEKSRQDVLNATKQLNQLIKDYWKPKLPILKDMLKNEVLKPNGVLEKACNRYKIEDISGKTEVKDSLLEFADALAGHMINNNFKTFYQDAGWFGKVATGGSAWGSSLNFLLDNIKGIAIGILIGAIIGGLLGGAGGAAVGGVIGLMLGLDLTRGFIEGFMFGPIVIGVILAYVAYLFTTAYVTTGIWGLGGPNILLVIITIILTVLLGMGQVWGKKV